MIELEFSDDELDLLESFRANCLLIKHNTTFAIKELKEKLNSVVEPINTLNDAIMKLISINIDIARMANRVLFFIDDLSRFKTMELASKLITMNADFSNEQRKYQKEIDECVEIITRGY